MTLFDVLTNHTFQLTLLGCTIIGFVAGSLGSFVYLRQQSLISDVISHSALPGVLGTFLLLTFLGLNGRAMVALLIGAALAGTAAVALTQWVPRVSRVDQSTSMAVVLTTFFGVGMLLLQVISDNPIPNKGGVQDYLFGNAGTLTRADVYSSAIIGGIALLAVFLLFKEITLSSFDRDQARVQGVAGWGIDALLYSCVAVATVIGVKAVGLVLMVAFVVTPPSVARQWTRSVGSMMLVSGFVGALASAIGGYVSIVYGPLPTGPVIVLVLFAMLVFSLVLSPRARKVAA